VHYWVFWDVVLCAYFHHKNVLDYTSNHSPVGDQQTYTSNYSPAGDQQTYEGRHEPTNGTQIHDIIKTLQDGPECAKEMYWSQGPWLGDKLEKA